MTKRHIDGTNLVDAARAAVAIAATPDPSVLVECARIAIELDRTIARVAAKYGPKPLRWQRAVIALWLHDRIDQSPVPLPRDFALVVLSYELGSHVVATSVGFETAIAAVMNHVALLRGVGVSVTPIDGLAALIELVRLIATDDVTP